MLELDQILRAVPDLGMAIACCIKNLENYEFL